MALRSKSVAIAAVSTLAGTLTYRVTGTIRGKQRRAQFMLLADAEAQRDAWEAERMSEAAALRPKITRLTHEQLKQCEAAIELLRGTGAELLDAVRHYLRNPPQRLCEITFEEAYQQFLAARKEFISNSQYWNYESVCRRLAAALSEGTKIADVTSTAIGDWMQALDLSSKTWNNYRADLSAVFNWFAAAPRRWLSENPIAELPRFRKRDTLPGHIEVLHWEKVREMMHWLEVERPQWVTVFALAVFAGIRPDRDEGEMGKLADAVSNQGAEKIFRCGSIWLTAAMTKDGRPRRVPITPNLASWLSKYPVTADSLRPGNRTEYAAIRKKWSVPHDGLRHTSISACAAQHGIAEAAVRHGTSEKICRDHYLNLLSPVEAAAFYAIEPVGRQHLTPSETCVEPTAA